MKSATNPFETDLFGGSPKTETCASVTSTGATTVPASPSARATLSSVLGTKLSSEPEKATPFSHGASRYIGVTGKKALNATSFATRVRTYRRSLSDRLTPSLISAGLVCGITPSSTRKQSGQPIQVLAFDTLAGADAARQPRGSSFSNGEA